MPYRVKSSELAIMTAEERKETLGGLIDAAKNDSKATRIVLESRIRELERRYGMSSEEMQARLAQGLIEDTAETSRWLILLRALSRYEPS